MEFKKMKKSLNNEKWFGMPKYQNKHDGYDDGEKVLVVKDLVRNALK